MNKKTKELAKILGHKDNEIILPNYKCIGERNVTKNFERALGMSYCCHNTGWGGKNPGTLMEHEKALLSSIDKTAAVQIKLKYESLIKMRAGWEKHWINQYINGQGYVRKERFEYITKKVFDKVDAILSKVNVDSYVAKNLDVLTEGFKVTLQNIENESLTFDEVLEGVSAGKISVKESKKLLDDITERNADKLCPFSGGADGVGRTRCSRTGDPKKLGDCGTCRVAAEWEEAYG